MSKKKFSSVEKLTPNHTCFLPWLITDNLNSGRRSLVFPLFITRASFNLQIIIFIK